MSGTKAKDVAAIVEDALYALVYKGSHYPFVVARSATL